MKSIHRLSCSKTVAPTLLNYLLNMLHEIHHSYLRGKHNAGVMLFSFIAQYRLSIYQCRIKITVRELRINLQFYWPLICDIIIQHQTIFSFFLIQQKSDIFKSYLQSISNLWRIAIIVLMKTCRLRSAKLCSSSRSNRILFSLVLFKW